MGLGDALFLCCSSCLILKNTVVLLLDGFLLLGVSLFNTDSIICSITPKLCMANRTCWRQIRKLLSKDISWTPNRHPKRSLLLWLQWFNIHRLLLVLEKVVVVSVVVYQLGLVRHLLYQECIYPIHLVFVVSLSLQFGTSAGEYGSFLHLFLFHDWGLLCWTWWKIVCGFGSWSLVWDLHREIVLCFFLHLDQLVYSQLNVTLDWRRLPASVCDWRNVSEARTSVATHHIWGLHRLLVLLSLNLNSLPNLLWTRTSLTPFLSSFLSHVLYRLSPTSP